MLGGSRMATAEALRRQHILEAAERLLCHYGPGKTTIAEIAREADVGVGTVYLEFTSKEAILEELSTRRYEGVLGAMREALGSGALRYATRLRAMLDARCEAMLRLAAAGPHARDLVHCGHAGVKSAHERYAATERALVADLLRAATQAREFSVADPEQGARTLLRAYVSFAPPFIFGSTADEVRRLHAAMHELVLKGLLRRPAR